MRLLRSLRRIVDCASLLTSSTSQDKFFWKKKPACSKPQNTYDQNLIFGSLGSIYVRNAILTYCDCLFYVWWEIWKKNTFSCSWNKKKKITKSDINANATLILASWQRVLTSPLSPDFSLSNSRIVKQSDNSSYLIITIINYYLELQLYELSKSLLN